MSPHLTAQVVRARQLEIAASTAHAQHIHELRIADSRSGHGRTSRLRRLAAVAAVVCRPWGGNEPATATARES